MIRLVLACLMLPSVAHAEDDPAMTFTANIGPELATTTNEVSLYAARIHLGVTLIPPMWDIHPVLTLGVTAGAGQVSSANERAADGMLESTYLDIGPEAQLGVRFGRGGFIRDRFFVGLAYLRSSIGEEIRFEHPEMRGGNGFRVSVGGNWARTWADILGKDGNKELAYFTLWLPQQFEVSVLRAAGDNRMTLTLSWGI